MYLAGYSLDNLSLMALTISTGFVVDDAIVMVENITRYIEEGKSPLDAALEGSRQIGFTIISLTVSLVAVLIPLLFMGGVVGRLFREFAVTLSVAIIVSAVLSLTLTPMMCAHLLKPEPPASTRGPLYRASERVFDGTLAFYDRGLKWVLGHQLTTLSAAIATLALTVLLAVLIPKGFFPAQDTGLLLGVTEAGPDVSFARMLELEERASDVVRRDPDVQNVVSFIGSDGTNPTTNSGRLSITLKPRKQRHANAEAIIARLRPRLAEVAGLEVHLQAVQDLQIDTRVSRTQYQYTLEDADAAELGIWADRLLTALERAPELSDVTTDQQNGGLALSLTIDRDSAARLGISSKSSTTRSTTPSARRQISTIFTQLNQYRVILEGDAGAAAESARARAHLRALEERRAGAALGVRALRATERAARRGPSGAIPRGDLVVQPRPRLVARRGGRRHPARAGEHRHAALRARRLRRYRPCVGESLSSARSCFWRP